ncbi:unnamed protein product [Clonostachys solani]|uniref:Methyltransferase domain-containing protein n=1 Tax=Clonostachys solani TaxID=160281 RepID=A0A9N9ZK29_9HYPO|nr:unnamed protein product [Clonostachys solani]
MTQRISHYTQGYSEQTLKTQQTRTAESDAAFILPHIKETDRILDIGCGAGTITTGFSKYASKGTIIGVDMSTEVLQKAKDLAAEANIPSEGSGSVIFEQGNVIEGFAYPDESFDIVYCSQVFGYFPPPEQPLQALAEIRRVLKSGGILATRDAAEQHFYPKNLEIDRLWVGNFRRAILKGLPDVEPTGTMMLVLFRKAGFDTDGGKVHIGTSSSASSGPEIRKWLAKRAASQLQEGETLRKNWLDAGITEKEIEQTLIAVSKWAETEDAWFASLQCEMLAWK